MNNDKARAEYALAQIGTLYDVEHMADDQNMDHEQRRQLRVRLAYPLIRVFEKWCVAEYPKVLPKSPIGKALAYTIAYMDGLARYVLDGRYRLDTNLIENSVRPVAVGRLCCAAHNLPTATGLAAFSLALSKSLDNLAENAIRPIALSRKNFLFCGNHEAAENTAVICSLLASCKASNINPREWMVDVID